MTEKNYTQNLAFCDIEELDNVRRAFESLGCLIGCSDNLPKDLPYLIDLVQERFDREFSILEGKLRG